MGDSNMVDNRPRPRSVLSFESKKSRRSSGSGPKLDLTEFSKDKKRLHTKADPSMAMNEAQPGRFFMRRLTMILLTLPAAVALEESNLENIRRMTWKDPTGTVIGRLISILLEGVHKC